MPTPPRPVATRPPTTHPTSRTTDRPAPNRGQPPEPPGKLRTTPTSAIPQRRTTQTKLPEPQPDTSRLAAANLAPMLR